MAKTAKNLAPVKGDFDESDFDSLIGRVRRVTKAVSDTITQNQNSVMNIASGLADMVKECAEGIKDHERKIAELKARMKNIQEDLLPDLLGSWNMKSFQTNELAIAVEPFFLATLSKDNAQEGLDWLEANGHGDIIKTEVVVSFTKGELEKAKAFLETVKDAPVELTREVHYQTLAKFGRELNAKGKQLPDCFTVHQGNLAKITKLK